MKRRLWIDRHGIAVVVGRWQYLWWRPGAQLPLSVRTGVPTGRFGTFHRRYRAAIAKHTT